ncbi:MAG TPA: hypothetical protein VD772_08950, partial [Anseongella sp.]|nr:hypothetical protein [Anseongella sp.]
MKSVLLAVLLSVCLFSAHAQERAAPLSSRAPLSKLSGTYQARRDLQLGIALTLAEQKGWPVFRVLPGGGLMYLERVDALGLPIYTATTNN